MTIMHSASAKGRTAIGPTPLAALTELAKLVINPRNVVYGVMEHKK